MKEHAANPMQAAAFLRDQNTAEKHHTQVSISFGEKMDPPAVRAAWDVVCATHPVLRSSFSRSNIGDVTVRTSPVPDTDWQTRDWREKNPQEIPDSWKDLQTTDAAAPLDPRSPVRFTEILLPGGGLHFLLTLPSFLLDESSIARVLLDWLVAMERPPATPADSPAPLATNTAWEEILKLAEAPLTLHPPPTGCRTGHCNIDGGTGRDRFVSGILQSPLDGPPRRAPQSLGIPAPPPGRDGQYLPRSLRRQTPSRRSRCFLKIGCPSSTHGHRKTGSVKPISPMKRSGPMPGSHHPPHSRQPPLRSLPRA